MPKINVLDKTLADMIAAGEVVERPSSAVKELVENALDAGARNITVEIRNGGMSYIRVADDGCGIAREDCPTAFLRHATSKISAPEDLAAIYTLGFRGEALASIAAVARVELFTKTKDEETGTTVTVEGGEVLECTDAGCPDGTTVVVRSLFYNTPARMKFLKSDAAEAGHVTDVVNKMILQNPAVSFKLINGGRQVAFSPGDGRLVSAVRAVWGKDWAGDMVEVDYTDEIAHVHGLAGNFSLARRDRRQQVFYVNGRNIVSPLLSAALSEAYQNTMMVGKHPVAVLNIDLNAALVDVNVHPTKMEVRFSEEKKVYSALYWAVKNALSVKKHIPEVRETVRREAKPEIAPTVQEKPVVTREKPMQSAPAPKQESGQINLLKDPYVKSAPRVTKESLTGTEVPVAFHQSTPKPYQKAEDEFVHTVPEAVAPEREKAPVPEAAPAKEDKPVQTEAVSATPRAGVDFALIGQAFATYILIQQGNDLLLIDQHAAHERLYFEQFKKEFEEKTISPQLLMLPVTVKLDPVAFEAAVANKALFDGLGFELDIFGETDIIIRTTPVMLDDGQIASAVEDIVGAILSHKEGVTPELFEHALHTVACKRALKGNSVLTREEMEHLAERVLALPDVNTCPHGRPITIKLSRGYLEKQFKRIV